MCAVCHGEYGVGVVPNTPNLAGQPEIYLAEQLKAYRSGTRSNEIMSVIAKPLTDAEIADLSAWFASIAIEKPLNRLQEDGYVLTLRWSNDTALISA
jgi:cytochrome c553